METSCKNNYNVSDAFATLVEITNIDMVKKISKNNDNLRLSKKRTTKTNNGKCC